MKKYKSFAEAYQVFQDNLTDFALATRDIQIFVGEPQFQGQNEFLEEARTEQQQARLNLTQLIHDLWIDEDK